MFVKSSSLRYHAHSAAKLLLHTLEKFFEKKYSVLLGSRYAQTRKNTERTFAAQRGKAKEQQRKENLEIVNFSRVFPQVYRRFSLYCLVVNKKKEKVGLQFWVSILFNRSIRKKLLRTKFLDVSCEQSFSR